MKRYTCKDMIKLLFVSFVTIFLLLVIWVLIIFIIGRNDLLIPCSIIVASFLIFLTPFYILAFKEHLGKVLIDDNNVTLFLFNKKYIIKRNQRCIMHCERERVRRQGPGRQFVKIRVGDSKDVIPIKIMDKEIINELTEALDIQRSPSYYRFDWEKEN